jgi:quinoprotein glucose dehydrogenase
VQTRFFLPALEGVDVGETGQRSHATTLLTPTLLMYGEGRGGEPNLRAVDKRTGEELARIAIPANTSTAPMTFMHEGKQYIVLSVAGPDHPAELVALTLPD